MVQEQLILNIFYLQLKQHLIFYHKFKDKSHVPKHIKKLKKIWEGRDILIVEGEKSRIGIGNDLFNNTKSIKRIICPAKHAFRV